MVKNFLILRISIHNKITFSIIASIDKGHPSFIFSVISVLKCNGVFIQCWFPPLSTSSLCTLVIHAIHLKEFSFEGEMFVNVLRLLTLKLPHGVPSYVK